LLLNSTKEIEREVWRTSLAGVFIEREVWRAKHAV
jgi:hypothetical protein